MNHFCSVPMFLYRHYFRQYLAVHDDDDQTAALVWEKRLLADTLFERRVKDMTSFHTEYQHAVDSSLYLRLTNDCGSFVPPLPPFVFSFNEIMLWHILLLHAKSNSILQRLAFHICHVITSASCVCTAQPFKCLKNIQYDMKLILIL